jgi:hypothetical protein
MPVSAGFVDARSHRVKKPHTVVISQPMYFPWVGQLEQLRLADTFVFYDDVQFSKGSFSNRVQVKTESGVRWMTVPLRDLHLGQLINGVALDQSRNWQRTHLDSFRQAYAQSPFLADALGLMESVFSKESNNLAALSINSMLELAQYFSLDIGRKFIRSSEINIQGHSTQRVIDICCAQGASLYLTGHGARNYLAHGAFEEKGIDVSYIEYRCVPYKQLHEGFTPYVTALDLVANYGSEGRSFILGRSVPWRDFVKQHDSERG